MDDDAKELAADELVRVTEYLQRAYPYIEQRKEEEGVINESPLDSLVRAVLSQNTNRSQPRPGLPGIEKSLRLLGGCRGSPAHRIGGCRTYGELCCHQSDAHSADPLPHLYRAR